MALEARLVAGGMIWLAALAASTGVPLTLGVLTRGTTVATALLMAAAATFLPRGTDRAAEAARGRPSGRIDWLVAGALATVALVYVLAYERGAVERPVGDVDSTSFILPTLAHWVRTGSLWTHPDFVAGWGFGAYPNTGGLLQLVTLVSWHSDVALRAVNPVVMAIGGGAVYALAAELGAPRAWGMAAAVLATMLPAGVISGLANAQTDSLAATGVAAGALFLVRHARTGARTELVLAALALGLAFGTKWYGPPEIAALLAVWVLVRLLARQPWRRVLGEAVGVGLGAGALGAVWLVRNAIEYGNPLFPSRIRALGIDAPPGLFAESQDFPLVHYASRPRILSDIVAPQLVDAFALAGGLALLGAIVAVLLARRGKDGRALGVALAALAVLATYTLLPYTALGPDGAPTLAKAAARYAVPGFMLAFASAAWAAGRGSRGVQAVAAGAAFLGLAHEIDRYPDFTLPGEFSIGAGRFAQALVVLALVVGAGALLRHRRPPAPAVGVAVALAALLVVAGGRRVEQNYAAVRYRGVEPTFDYIAAQAPAAMTVGLAGLQGTQPRSLGIVAFGPRFGNDVRFVGERTDGLLRRASDAAAFRRRLRGVDILAVGAEPGSPAPETAWARAAGWRPVAESATYTLLAHP